MNRRTLLQIGTVGALPAFGGCGAYDFPRDRALDAIEIEVHKEASDWVLTLTVKAGATGFADESREAFHDVILLAFDEDWDQVCSKSVGDFSSLDPVETRQVTVQCDGFPHHITFQAAESPCDKNTRILISSYSGTFDNVGREWGNERERECGEKLPPE